MTPVEQFATAWLAYGVFMVILVLVRAGQPRHHRTKAVGFYLAIMILGPLMLILAFVPNDVVQRTARTMRDRLDGLPR